MKHKLLLLVCCALLPASLRAQQSVCDLFRDLKGADNQQLTLAGDLIVSKDIADLGAADCDNKYISNRMIWPTALSLHLSELSPQYLEQFRDAAAKAEGLRQAGKAVSASAVLTGRLHVVSSGDLPAEFTIASVDSITVDELPDASQLPVIPICDLFQDLAAWKGKRIAVRGEGAGTEEGYWIVGRCQGSFATNGYTWPVSLNYGRPAYYSSSTASLSEAKIPKLPAKNEDLLRGRFNVVNTATYIGRLRMRDQYSARCRGGGDYITNGFGHLNSAAAELAVEEVRDRELTARGPVALDAAEEEAACVPPDLDSLCAGATTLEKAVSLNCAERTNELLAKDGIDSKDGSASPALGTAILLGYRAIVSRLLDAGAPINPTDIVLFSPLEEAAQSGKIDIMNMLLKKGAKVDRPNDRGETYLASGGFFDVRVMKVLLDAGANPNAKDRHGETALMHAADYGFEDAVRILIQQKAGVNLTDEKGRSALMHAAAGEYVDAIPLLLAAGANLYARDLEGKSALDIAKESKNQVAEKLISDLIPGSR